MIVPLAGKSAPLGVALFVAWHSLISRNAGTEISCFGVITGEYGTQSIDLFVLMNASCSKLMNVLCTFPKVAGKVETLFSSMRTIISLFQLS